MWSDLKARILTAIVAIPLLLFLLWKGGLYFLALIGFLAVVFILEAEHLAGKTGAGFNRWVNAFSLLICIVIAHFNDALLPAALTACILLILTSALFSSRPAEEAVYGLFFLIYPLTGFIHAVFLRDLPQGFEFFIYTLVGTFLADTGAYFAGKAFGRHKVAPAISPGKSWEGVAGGVTLSYMGLVVAVYVIEKKWIFSWTFPFALGVTFLGLAGDLVESALKRRAGVKDSGTFFPGHGGVMDRVDSLMFNIPFAFYFFTKILGV